MNTQASSSISSSSDVIESDKNDNSNPQQGSGGTRVSNKGKDLFEHEKQMSSPANQRLSMKIPPTTKDSRKLFVGGLPADITNEEFHTFFQQFGIVMDSVVMFDRETRRSRGFGFVTFEDPAVCEYLLSLGHESVGSDQTQRSGRLEMRGKLIEVKSAEPKEPSSNRNNSRGRQGAVSNRGTNYAAPIAMDPSHNGGWPYYSGPYDQYAAANGYHHHYHAAAFPMAAGYMAPMYYHHGMNMQAPAPGQMMNVDQNQVAPAPYGQHYYPYADGMHDPNAATHIPYPQAYAFFPQVPMMAAAVPLPVPPQPPLQSAETTSVMQPVAPGIPGKVDGDEVDTKS